WWVVGLWGFGVGLGVWVLCVFVWVWVGVGWVCGGCGGFFGVWCCCVVFGSWVLGGGVWLLVVWRGRFWCGVGGGVVSGVGVDVLWFWVGLWCLVGWVGCGFVLLWGCWWLLCFVWVFVGWCWLLLCCGGFVFCVCFGGLWLGVFLCFLVLFLVVLGGGVGGGWFCLWGWGSGGGWGCVWLWCGGGWGGWAVWA
ncbi:hypothetical protein RA273_27655, partial [Pseudomonas syringae pv. tagetis]